MLGRIVSDGCHGWGNFVPWKQQALIDGIGDNTGDPVDPECLTAKCSEVQTFDRIREAGGQVLVGMDSLVDQVEIGVHANLRELVGYGWNLTRRSGPPLLLRHGISGLMAKSEP